MEKAETEYLTYSLTNSGILIARFKSDISITVDIAKQIVSSRKAFCKGKAYPLLSDIRNIKYAADTKTREYFQSEEAREGILAGALLTDSIFTNYLGNIFLRVAYKKKTIPTKIFLKEEEAIGWLLKYKE